MEDVPRELREDHLLTIQNNQNVCVRDTTRGTRFLYIHGRTGSAADEIDRIDTLKALAMLKGQGRTANYISSRPTIHTHVTFIELMCVVSSFWVYIAAIVKHPPAETHMGCFYSILFRITIFNLMQEYPRCRSQLPGCWPKCSHD